MRINEVHTHTRTRTIEGCYKNIIPLVRVDDDFSMTARTQLTAHTLTSNQLLNSSNNNQTGARKDSYSQSQQSKYSSFTKRFRNGKTQRKNPTNGNNNNNSHGNENRVERIETMLRHAFGFSFCFVYAGLRAQRMCVSVDVCVIQLYIRTKARLSRCS